MKTRLLNLENVACAKNKETQLNIISHKRAKFQVFLFYQMSMEIEIGWEWKDLI